MTGEIMTDMSALEVGLEHPTPNGALRVRLELDPCCESPRHDDFRIAVITTETRSGHPQESPDRKVERGLERFSNRRVVARWLKLCHGATVVLPLYNGNDGAILPGDADEARWGGIGIAYDTPETRAHLGDNSSPEAVEAAIRAELTVYNAWTQGECYGYVVERQGATCPTCDGEPPWEHVASCWGYIGYEYAEAAALEALRGELADAVGPEGNPPENTTQGNE